MLFVVHCHLLFLKFLAQRKSILGKIVWRVWHVHFSGYSKMSLRIISLCWKPKWLGWLCTLLKNIMRFFVSILLESSRELVLLCNLPLQIFFPENRSRKRGQTHKCEIWSFLCEGEMRKRNLDLLLLLSGSVYWYFVLLNYVKDDDLAGCSTACASLLTAVSRQLQDRLTPMEALLQTRYFTFEMTNDGPFWIWYYLCTELLWYIFA